jgi:hypothetical protein
LDEYSITSFLEILTVDELEKKIIKLISEGHMDEDLLERILDISGSGQK